MFLHSPLIRNGYALIASAGLTSVLGLLYWILAARLYSPEQVGVAAALISTMMTLGNIAQLNLENVLNRFLPVAGKGARKVVLLAYFGAATASFCLSLVTVYSVGWFIDEASFLRAEPLAAGAFVLASVAWTLFALQDSVLAGLRQSTFVPIENTIFAVSKLVLLIIFSGSSVLGSGIYAAWVLPLPFLLAFANWFIFRRFLPRHTLVSRPDAELDRKTIAAYFGWDYIGTMASMTAIGVAPLLVFHVSGSAALARYYLAWQIAYSLYLIGRSMGVSLLTEVGFEQHKIRSLMAEALIYTMVPLASAVILLVAGAPYLMQLFGDSYGHDATLLLQIGALACLPWGWVTLSLAVARAQGRTILVAVAELITCAIVLGGGSILLKRYGVVGMSVAWLIAHSTVAIGIIAYVIMQRGVGILFEAALHVGSALAQVKDGFDAAIRPNPKGNLPAELLSLIEKAGGCDLTTWCIVAEPRRESDIRTIFLAESGASSPAAAAPALVVKVAKSTEAKEGLKHYVDQVKRLSCDKRLSEVGFELPSLLAVDFSSSESISVERVLPATDGRAALALTPSANVGLANAMDAIAQVHRFTAASTVLDQRWLDRWIEHPAAIIRKTAGVTLLEGQRKAAIDALIREQTHFWQGRKLSVGLGHGDYCPANILFGPAVDVSAVIDWEAANYEMPPGIDAMHLLMTQRAMRANEELGHVVRELLSKPALQNYEVAALGEIERQCVTAYGSLKEPAIIQALCGFAWLQHVAANLRKSRRFRTGRLWLAVNVEHVLRTYLQRANPEASSV
ncbi:phosphotransferase [Pseudaminobacter soli (ex Li et al. 2025)]|nr:phosphotransferase [Mesorhizobium soli]